MKYQHARDAVERELEMQIRLAERRQVLNIPLLLGPVGLGKTAMAQDLADKYGLELITINTGENSDPTDIAGLPLPEATEEQDGDIALRYTEWCLNKAAALACSRPVFLFFDDIDKAPSQVVAGLLGILANRMFRMSKIARGTLIMAAGNRVDDDMLAEELSESLLTRVTPIEIEPDIKQFTEWGTESGEIHGHVLGFLNYKPEYLHQKAKSKSDYRFPTSRGWWEASQQMFVFDTPEKEFAGMPNWKGIVARKCGTAVANDFWAWYQILKNIDAERLLTTGDMSAAPKDDSKGARRQWEYAAVFAIASKLTREVKPTYKGLEKIASELPAELALALGVQLPSKTKAEITSLFPDAWEQLARGLLGNLKLQKGV